MMRIDGRVIGLVAGVCLAGLAVADVKVVSKGPVVDGALDDACWAKAEWCSGFQAKLSNPDREIRNPTSFAVVSDRRNVYFGFRCDESDVAAVRNEPLGSLWTMNQVNLLLAPSGNGFSFYQFAFSPTHGLTASLAYSEGGNILCEPDYLPEWEVKTAFGEKGWTAEVRIPVNAFYHTRADEWKKEWLVNIGRVRIAPDKTEKSSWSPVQDVFPEPKFFRPLGGFPARAWRDDVALTDVQFVPSGLVTGCVAGVLSANLHLKARGDFTLTATAGDRPLAFQRLKGDGIVRIPATFRENGAYTVGLELVRKPEDGSARPLAYRREAKVRVDFRPVDVRFTKPAYRANFYPGQDSSSVAGTVSVAAGGEVRVEIEGPGIPRQETVLTGASGAPRPFSFATPGFAEGEAKVTVTAGGERHAFAVRKLAKSAHRMSWVENGNLVVDGRPIVSRRIAHPGYRGGAWLDAIFKTNEMHDTTGYVAERPLEFGRLVPGSEPREGTKDQKPSQEVLDAVAKRMDELKDQDFVFWYICDEPECRRISPVYLKHLYDFVTARDPYHVIRTGTRAPKRYLDCCDWFETHPYINPQNLPDGRRVYGRAINAVGDFVSEIADLRRPDKIIGFYTTAFAYTYKNPLSDYPTFDEYVTHAWAGMIRGARTIIPYAYHDIGDRASILEGTRFVFEQIEVLSPFILADRRTVVRKTPEVEIVKYACGEDTLTVTVDFKQLKVTLDVTGDYAAKLPSYEKAAALVDRLEHARTHNGNLLFGKWQKLPLDASFKTTKKGKRPTDCYKLTDGVRNVYAGQLLATKENWLAADLSAIDRPFTKVVLWGDMKKAKMQVKVDGAWQEPLEGVRDGDWCFRFTLPASPRPEAIKFLLNRGRVEVYELEVFE